MIRIIHYQYTKHKSAIKKIYEESFPSSERFDFSILRKCNEESNVHLSCILCDDYPVGMQFTVELPNDITYLMYYAIDKEYRNQGIGSQALQNLVIAKDKIMLCIEKPVDAITQRRKMFYLRNGFYETGMIFEDAGELYEVLVSCKEYKPTVPDLLNRYKFMTNKKAVWRKIKSTFSVEYIDLLPHEEEDYNGEFSISVG